MSWQSSFLELLLLVCGRNKINQNGRVVCVNLFKSIFSDVHDIKTHVHLCEDVRSDWRLRLRLCCLWLIVHVNSLTVAVSYFTCVGGV